MTVTTLSGMFTIREFAEYAHLSVTKVRSLIRSGQLEAHRIGRCVRILARDVEVWESSLPSTREAAS